MKDTLVFRGRWTGIALAVLGLVLVGLAGVIPFAARAPVLAFVLMGAPALLTGVVALVHGFAVLPARIHLSADRLEAALPKHRVFPVPPVRRVAVEWNQVLAVRRRMEVYSLLGVPAFPVETHAVETTRGTLIIGGRSIPGTRQAVEMIARRSGRRVQDEGALSLPLVRSLLRGAPPFGAMLEP